MNDLETRSLEPNKITTTTKHQQILGHTVMENNTKINAIKRNISHIG